MENIGEKQSLSTYQNRITVEVESEQIVVYREIQKHPDMAGYVVDETRNQYYIHIGPEPTKDPKNNVRKLPQIMQIAFNAFDKSQSNSILVRRCKMRPLAW
jgi:hypothetical protein